MTWIKRKGSATKLLGKPASDAGAQVTTGFATGHAWLSFLHTSHCSIQRITTIIAKKKWEKTNKTQLCERRSGYGFDGLEGEGGAPVEDADGPRTLAVRAAAEGGVRREAEGFGERREGEPGEESGGGAEEDGGRGDEEEGGGAEASPRPQPPPRSHCLGLFAVYASFLQNLKPFFNFKRP